MVTASSSSRMVRELDLFRRKLDASAPCPTYRIKRTSELRAHAAKFVLHREPTDARISLANEPIA